STVPGAKTPGRDHWAPCFFGLFAGAGVRGGQVIGRSDKIGAYPATTPYTPDDIGATVYHMLGVDPSVEVRDRQGRPVRLNRGDVMSALFTGWPGGADIPACRTPGQTGMSAPPLFWWGRHSCAVLVGQAFLPALTPRQTGMSAPPGLFF